MKAAHGIVLPKPGKPSYTDASSKILQHIFAIRLYDHACTVNLIHQNQFGSLTNLGVNDATTTLFHEVKSLQAGN